MLAKILSTLRSNSWMRTCILDCNRFNWHHLYFQMSEDNLMLIKSVSSIIVDGLYLFVSIISDKWKTIHARLHARAIGDIVINGKEDMKWSLPTGDFFYAVVESSSSCERIWNGMHREWFDLRD